MINPKLFDEEKYAEHHIEECAEILLEAEEIKKDAKLMEQIKEYLDRKKDKITSLSQLKEKANNLEEKEEDEE